MRKVVFAGKERFVLVRVRHVLDELRSAGIELQVLLAP